MAKKNDSLSEISTFISAHSDGIFFLLFLFVLCVPLSQVLVICSSSLIAIHMIWRGFKYHLDQKHEEKMAELRVKEILDGKSGGPE